MEAKVKRTFLVAVLALATAIPSMRISAAPNPGVKSGVDRLYVIDCGDGSGPDESRWTPGANVGSPVDFPGRLPGRIDFAETAFASANDLASALRRAEAAHGQHEKRTGERDANWPDWYAEYMVAEQAGKELPQ